MVVNAWIYLYFHRRFNSNETGGGYSWKPRCAWLTFDDGWVGFEAHLLPILEKYHCPATLFIPPKEIVRGQVWTNSILAEHPDLKAYYPLPAEERYARVDVILGRIGNPRRLAPEAELRRLAHHPLITLENHTYTHLSCAARPIEEVLDEVKTTQSILTQWTGRTPKMCCYPFGHHTSESDQALIDIGIIPVHSNPGTMTLQSIGSVRNMFHETMTTAENIGRVLGAWLNVKVRTH